MRNNPLIFILTFGVFGIINTEMGVIGIIPLIAETFRVSVPTAGWTVSVFAFVVALSGPIMPMLFSPMNRKTAMILSLGIFVASNIISMLTSSFTILLIARAIPALFHPVYVSMAFTIAAKSVSKADAPKAISKVFIGVSAGMVLGVPMTSFIASETSFAIAMLFFTIVNMGVLLATILLVPSMPIIERLSYGEQFGVLKKAIVWNSILAVTFVNGAIFGFFSFMSDYLKNITGLTFKVISAILFIYGASNILGNILAGKLLAQNPKLTLKMTPIALGILYILLFFFGEFSLSVTLIILGLGILAGISANNTQYMLSTAAPEAPDFANGLFLTSANLGTAIGTAFCGLFIAELGAKYAVAGTMIFLILSVFFIYLRASSPKHKENF